MNVKGFANAVPKMWLRASLMILGGGAEVTPSRKVLQWNLARRANSTEETMAGTHTV